MFQKKYLIHLELVRKIQDLVAHKTVFYIDISRRYVQLQLFLSYSKAEDSQVPHERRIGSELHPHLGYIVDINFESEKSNEVKTPKTHFPSFNFSTRGKKKQEISRTRVVINIFE